MTAIRVCSPSQGFYDTQYTERSVPDCRGRLRTDDEGRYGYRAVVPVAYPIPGDVGFIRSPPSLSTPFHAFVLVACLLSFRDTKRKIRAPWASSF